MVDVIEVPLSPLELSERWRRMCVDPTFEDVPGKIELTQWGEILISPVGKAHGLLAVSLSVLLMRKLGGRAMVEVGILTTAGIRAPDVAWCSDGFLAEHPEDAPLSAAPELCIEIASPGNAMPKLREKASAYLAAGATEAWIVVPTSRTLEIHGAGGRIDLSQFGIQPAEIFE